MNKKLLAGIGSFVGFVALSAGIVWASVALPNPALEPTPTPTAAVSAFELNGYAEAPPKPTPEPVVPEVTAPIAEAPAPTEPETTYNEETGEVTGPGCPLPYVDLGYGCQVAP